MIFHGSAHGMTEGAHLFRRGRCYYLTTAEGGTGYDDALTMARARDIAGRCELHPDQHLMTMRFAPDNPVQRVGHGQYVETPEGACYHTYLCGRPLTSQRGRFRAFGA